MGKRNLIRNLLVIGLLAGIYALVQLLAAKRVLLPYDLQILGLICVNIMLAVSLNLINGFTGQFSIGHAGFFGIGAYASAYLTVVHGTPFLIALLIGAGFAALVGVLIGLPTLRLQGDYLAIATLGFGEIIRVVILNIPSIGGARGFSGISRMTTFGHTYLFMILTVVIIKNFISSYHGRACIAVREDELASEALGINTTFYKVSAFTIGAFFAGLAGGLFSHFMGYINPATNQIGFLKSIDILIMVVLGGLGSITGSVGAAIFLTLIPELLRGLAEYRMVVYPIILILVMLFRPSGLLGDKELSWEAIANLYYKVTRKKPEQDANTSATDCLLQINKLSVSFGGLRAISNVDMSVSEGELVGLIGPNGAGKTTLFNALTGLCRPTSGEIIFFGQNLTKKPAHYICHEGITRTFQNIRLFKSLTALENLRIAYHQNMHYSFSSGILQTIRAKRQEEEAAEHAYAMLEIVGLTPYAHERAVNLSYGNQRKLEIARALVTKPKLLLLDEPAAGMNPAETQELLNLIRSLRSDFGLTIILIEHDMNLVMNLCERIFVLDYGVLIAQGSVEEVRSNEQVIQAYLGADA
ncbi:MAG: branched-chain amino acid ABC transporter ATP-binding protein/permease [Bacillota bacterium]|nr:branched-chain amino acid ABC transporter ATP-binding protein/permease [Bacillota bacterium]